MRVSTCCGCCSVSTGVQIIGGLTAICSVLSIVLIAVQEVFILGVYVPHIVYFLCGGLLIVGVQTRKSEYIFPMLSIYFVSLILGVPFIVVHIIQISVLYGISAGYSIGILLIVSLGVSLLLYFHMVVDTFYKDLLREEHTNAKMDGDFNVHLSNKPHFQSA